MIEDEEECDDGNTINGDGCDFLCMTEGADDVCIDGVCNDFRDFCGNGITEFQYGEQCDDGNTMNGDGCSSICQSEAGFIRRNQFFPSICTKCGNGISDAGEQCDDGNFMTGDGCSASCAV